MRRILLVLGLGVAGLGSPCAAVAGALERPPEEACDYLAGEGLAAADRYREFRAGQYYCWSLRKEVPAGDARRDSIRYEAQGSAEIVSRLALELRVASPGQAQRAQKAFLGYVKVLVKKALGEDPPAEIDAAVMSARPGRWPLAGADLVLEKAKAPAAGYDLTFRVE